MRSRNSSRYLLSAALALSLLSFGGCAELNDPYYRGGNSGGYDPYYGGYGHDAYDHRRERDRDRWERRELERERERLEEERERLEEERRRDQGSYAPPPPPPPQDRCPPGYSPSERKCSPDERRRGCKDIRLPSGLGCVNR